MSNSSNDGLAGLLTIRQVEQDLQLSYASVHRLVRADQLPSIQIGGSRRFRIQDLDAFVAAHQVHRRHIAL